VAAVGLGLEYKINVLHPKAFLDRRLENAKVLYGMRMKWKDDQPVNFYHELKMQSKKIPVGFNGSALAKVALSSINSDVQPFKINVAFEDIVESVGTAFVDPAHPIYPISGSFTSVDKAINFGFRTPFKNLKEFDIVIKASARYFYPCHI
jgi:hypothetical protein